VRFVYNYDLPDVPENYVHRIGRTARAGAAGQAVAFCAPDEMDALKAIQKLMALRIPIGSGRPWEDIEIPAGKKNGARPSGNRRRKPSGSNSQGGHSAKPSMTGAQRARQRRKSKAARSAA
jgi:ATP-dependent RNA helicase RhlE